MVPKSVTILHNRAIIMEYYNAMYIFKNAANENNDKNMYHLVICHINDHVIIVFYVHMHSMIIF